MLLCSLETEYAQNNHNCHSECTHIHHVMHVNTYIHTYMNGYIKCTYMYVLVNYIDTYISCDPHTCIPLYIYIYISIHVANRIHADGLATYAYAHESMHACIVRSYA